MFRIDDSKTFKWKVTYFYPATDGERLTGEFTVTFKRMPESYINDALLTKNKSVDQVIDDVLAGFEDVQGADGKPMKFTPENKKLLLDLAGMPTAIFAAYFDSSKQAKEKN